MKEHSNGPTKIKTAVLSDLLFFVCSKLGRYGSLITPILAELMKCIYKNFDANAVKAGESVRTFYQLTPFFELCDNLEETAADVCKICRRFQYFFILLSIRFSFLVLFLDSTFC